jgi:hypothetical protein
MSLICDLSEDLVETILKSWVNVEDVGRLDSAMCNRSERPTFLSLLSGDQFALGHPLARDGCDEKSDDGDEKSEACIDPFLSWAMGRHIAVTELIVSASFTSNTDKRLKYLRHHGKHIQKVALDECAGTARNCKAAINDICAHCPNVVMFEARIPLSTTTYAVIADNWRNLTRLTLKDDVIGDAILLIGENCQSLVDLWIPGSRWVPQPYRFFQVCSPNLESIVLGAALEPADYIAIASRCHLLRDLDGPTDLMNDAALIALGPGCPLLCSLELVNNQLVTNAGLIALARNEALSSLFLVSALLLTDEGLRAVAQCSPKLENVEIRNCNVSDVTLVALGRHCHYLRTLTIRGLDITNEGLRAIAAGCPLLEELTTSCDGVGLAIEAIARGCPRLRRLFVLGEALPAVALLAVASCCPLLEEILMCGEQIRDAEVTALVLGYPVLTTLIMPLTSVTVHGLCAVREHGKALRKLGLSANMFPGVDFFHSIVHVETY